MPCPLSHGTGRKSVKQGVWVIVWIEEPCLGIRQRRNHVIFIRPVPNYRQFSHKQADLVNFFLPAGIELEMCEALGTVLQQTTPTPHPKLPYPTPIHEASIQHKQLLSSGENDKAVSPSS